MKARQRQAMPRAPSAAKPRVALADRLRERREEIEEALLTRTYSIADPAEAADPEYERGLRAAVSAALDYGLAGIEHSEERARPVPVLLLAQARLAARNGVSLDTVLRRYFAGYTLLVDFIVSESGAVGLKESGLKRLLRDQASMFDLFLSVVSEEHAREREAYSASTEERQVEQVERLLAGEMVDASSFAYELGGWHLGIVATGTQVADGVRQLARAMDLRTLSVKRGDGRTAAWLGSRRRTESSAVEVAATTSLGDGVLLAIGEPGLGLGGWRLTHRQAAVALPIAERRAENVVRYADVALLAAVANDELLATSLHRLYLAPLDTERDGGMALRETLQAYFASEMSLSSAAARLGISARAVGNRLRKVEEKIGRPLQAALADIEVALRLEELGGTRASQSEALDTRSS